jgi:hypothetical protein
MTVNAYETFSRPVGARIVESRIERYRNHHRLSLRFSVAARRDPGRTSLHQADCFTLTIRIEQRADCFCQARLLHRLNGVVIDGAICSNDEFNVNIPGYQLPPGFLRILQVIFYVLIKLAFPSWKFRGHSTRLVVRRIGGFAGSLTKHV